MPKEATETLVSTVNSNLTKEDTMRSKVKTGKLGVTIPGGQVLEVRCQVKAWHKGGTVIFEPMSVRVIPEGLELFPAVVKVLLGASKTVKIPVQNSTKHTIYLPQRRILGNIEEISEIRPIYSSSNIEQSGKQISSAVLCSSQARSTEYVCNREEHNGWRVEKNGTHPLILDISVTRNKMW